MHLERLDLNLLVAIDALMRNKSVTAAARELNLTQSALSAALKRARQHYDDELLYFDGQQMVPTPFGRNLQDEVPDIIARLRGLARMRARSELANLHRRFSIIASDYVAVVYLSKLVRQLAEAAPGISIVVLPFTDNTVRRFHRGAIDFMIGPGFATDDLGQIDELHPLFSDSFLCAVARDNPLLTDGLTQQAFRDAPHVTTNFYLENGNSHFERWLVDQGLNVRVVAALPSFAVLPHFIAGTRNIATIHKRLVPHFQSNPQLVFLKPPYPVPILQENLITKQQLTYDTEARLLRQFMLRIGQDMRQDDTAPAPKPAPDHPAAAG